MSRSWPAILLLCVLAACSRPGDYRLARLSRTDGDGNLSEAIRYRYDKRNRLVAEELTAPTGKLLRQTRYEYDVDGYRTQKRVCDGAGKTIETELYSNDDNGLCFTMTRTDEHDSLRVYVEYRYDAEGNQVAETIHDRGMRITEITESHADRSGRVTRRQFFGLDGVRLGHEQNEFDERGNLIQVHRYNISNHEIETIDQEYDQKGRLIVVRDERESEGTSVTTRVYDRHGRLSRVIYRSPAGGVEWIEVHEYEQKPRN